MLLEYWEDLPRIYFLFLLELVFSQFEFSRCFIEAIPVALKVEDEGILSCTYAAQHELEVLD